jgi:hypothetical protein
MKNTRVVSILACHALLAVLCACSAGVTPPQSEVRADVKAGDIVVFGRYEQDDDRVNGKEPISWRVLEVRDGKALLLSDKNLDAKAYNTSETSLTWATSTIRAWLNKDFLSTAFTKSEVSVLAETTNSNPDNPTYGTAGGDATLDKVFFLSIEEVEEYLTTDASRIGLNSAYAIGQGADDIAGAGWWWLRSPGLYRSAACVSRDGPLFVGGRSTNDDRSSVRPAIWVQLAS